MARRGDSGDVAAAAAVLARAFAHDPLLGAFVRRRDAVPALRRFFVREAQLALAAHGELWLDDDSLGAAVWRSPGRWLDQPLAQLRSLPVWIGAFGRGFGRATRAANALARAHPRDPHWYLPFVGVDPAATGSGRGAALLEPVLERLDAEGAAAYLEATSAASARLFSRLGFEPREELIPVDGVVVRTMWRPAVR